MTVFLRVPSVERTKGERHALTLQIQALVDAEPLHPLPPITPPMLAEQEALLSFKTAM